MENNRRALRACAALCISALLGLGFVGASAALAGTSRVVNEADSNAVVAPPTSADFAVPTPSAAPNSVDVVTVPAGETEHEEPDKDDDRDSAIIILLVVIGAGVLIAGIVVYVKRGGKID